MDYPTPSFRGRPSASAAALICVCLFLLATLTLCSASDSEGSRNLTTASTPSWVLPVPWPSSTEGPTSGTPIHTRLVDVQINGTLRPLQRYLHFVSRVDNEQGVSPASQISVSFDPSFQSVVIHDVSVHRGGQKLDRRDLSKWQVIQREERLDYQIYDGELTALLLLEDVRVGDVVEFAYSLVGSNPDLADHFDWVIPMMSPSPVDRFLVSMVWDPHRPLTIRNLGRGSIPNPHIESVAGNRRYVWSVAPLPPLELEDDLPLSYVPYPVLQLSSLGSWSEIVDWGRRLYDSPVGSAGLDETLARIRKAAEGDSEREALGAIRFVQDEVRYLAVLMGSGSFRPTPPQQVVKRRFGDCKDKAVLTVALLRALGWDARPALVSGAYEGEIARFAPSRTVFDHVIVHLERHGRTYWIDPTMQGQRGRSLSQLWIPHFESALILSPGITQPSPVQASSDSKPLTTIEKTFDVASYDGPGHLQVVTTYYGASAEGTRRQVSATSLAELSRGYRTFYERFYPGIETKDSLKIRDDEELNQIKIIESYSIPEFWKKLPEQSRWSAEVAPVELFAMIPQVPSGNRKMPVMVNMPAHVIISSKLKLPEKFDSQGDKEVIQNEGFRLQISSWSEEGALKLLNDLERLQRTLPASAAPAYARDLAKIEDAVRYDLLSGIRTSGAGTVHWAALFGLLLLAAGCTWGGIFIYRLQPARAAGAYVPAAAPLDATTPDDSEPTDEPGTATSEPVEQSEANASPPAALPIGGVLILPAIGLFAGLIRVLPETWKTLQILQAEYWTAAIHHGAVQSSTMGLLLAFEAGTNVILVAGATLMIVMFFKRRRLFPLLYVLFTVFGIVAHVLDLMGGTAIGNPPEASDRMRLTGELIGLGIWATYFFRSKRARETFVL